MTPTLTHYIHPVLGCLQLHFNDDVLIKVDLPYPHLYQEANASLPLIWQTQFDAYFTGRLQSFEGDILIQGSEHDRKVWQAMLNTPYGQTRTYGDVAKEIGSAAQAVGQACKRNPVPLIIPCHRIVGQHHIGGYSGGTGDDTLSIKHWLLEHERTHAS
ncbi:methylated-DNA--[protein]-cysteine S-methyltransferase [Vitreoscilla stercoraria]|uniref:Methylated-DNA--[protein]-cysteine S-methyltransferase n=1 Tax=Vitreoscilla stercoraria TaxID=61 RepID=A0ABY4E8E7_VITST|nr:methylated-DNA--[protein]-cysteine S-methyltransferase [Vitreoscilla stercoraria]UOO92033.1 methylated-DNA--[protein]-cysteine S-methyltransferase [Vitreoscilla stercoraria]